MKTEIDKVIMRNTVFAWIALATCIALLVPAIAMQFTPEVNWDITDFLVMGALLFGTGSLFVLVARKVRRKYWLVTGVVLAAGFLWIWAELAVGVFTDWGS